MRTIRTVIRITERNGKEVYRGKRSAVVRKLSTISRRGNIADYQVEVGKYDPAVSSEPDVWGPKQQADEFVRVDGGKRGS